MCEISIIIRSFEEEKWIGECLRGLHNQTVQDFEVVLVDNCSTDKTVAKARNLRPNITILEIEDYLPGLALNTGIRASQGKFLVCLSAHCIPTEESWLESLRRNFDEHDNIAGVYGRQLPVESSDPIDTRDLLRMFGPEKRVQTHHTFFHNANSMIRREVWEEFPFNEEVTNIEDQIWANAVLEAGYKIVYEPAAAVYHFHGINQANDTTRMRNVVETMKKYEILAGNDPAADFDTNPFDPVEADIVSFIPIRQEADGSVNTNETLIRDTLDAATESAYINDTYVATDSEYIVDRVDDWDATGTIMRPEELAADDIEVIDVYQYALEHLEKGDRYPDIVVTLDITHPFRPPGFLDDIVGYLIRNGHDTVVPVYPELRPSWIEQNDALTRVNESGLRSNRLPVHIGLFSLGTVMYPPIL